MVFVSNCFEPHNLDHNWLTIWCLRKANSVPRNLDRSYPCIMWSVVAKEVNFGMPVAYMIWAEQRATYIWLALALTHPTRTFALLEHNLLFTFCSTAVVVRLGAPLSRCLKSSLNSILRAGIKSARSNCTKLIYLSLAAVVAHAFDARTWHFAPDR